MAEEIKAHITGTVWKIVVAVGDEVEEAQAGGVQLLRLRGDGTRISLEQVENVGSDQGGDGPLGIALHWLHGDLPGKTQGSRARESL